MPLPRLHFGNILIILAWFCAWISVMGYRILHGQLDNIFIVSVVAFVGSGFTLLLLWDVQCADRDDPKVVLSFFNLTIAHWPLSGFVEARTLSIAQMWGRSMRDTINSVNLVGPQMLFRKQVILLRANKGTNLLVSPHNMEIFRQSLVQSGIPVLK